jgi:hypothetical protein
MNSILPCPKSPEQKQIPHRLVIDGNVQVRRRNTDVGVPSGVTNFRERTAASKRVADEGVAPPH